MGVDTILVGFVVVVRMGGQVDDHGGLGADALHAVQDAGRNHQQDVVALTHEEFVHLALGGRIVASVVENHLSHALDADEVVGLQVMVVPAFNHARIDSRQVDLAELLEERVVGPHHFH